MVERGVAAARRPRKHPSGTPRVAPFSGLDVAGRARRKPRAGAGEESAVQVAEATAPGCKVAAAERREASARAQRVRAARRDGKKVAPCGAPLPYMREGKGNEGAPRAFSKNRGGGALANFAPRLFDNRI